MHSEALHTESTWAILQDLINPDGRLEDVLANAALQIAGDTSTITISGCTSHMPFQFRL